MSSLTDEQKQDLESLSEIYDAIGIGQGLEDGAYGYRFNDEELSNAFEQSKKSADLIQRKYIGLMTLD